MSSEASLYNGISQQSPELRLPSQVADITNANLTLSRGMEMRPPVEIISQIDGLFSSDSLVHPVNDSPTNSYLIVIPGAGSTLTNQVFDTATGASFPIVFEDAAAQAYLETANSDGDFIPTEALQMSSVLDYTFTSNKNVIPALDETALRPALVEEAYLWVKNGVQQVERKLVVNGTTVTHAKNASNDSQIVVDYFVANVPAGFTATKISSAVLRIVKDDGAAFTCTATDSYSDTTMAASRSDGLKFEDLPPIAVDGAIMTIVPEENQDSEYYLSYDEDTKSWFEISAPGEAYKFDNTTMPHAFLEKIDDGVGTVTGTPDQIYFSFERINYVEKETGGETSNPSPSFVGNPIADTFFFKNRLGFIAGDSVILSATDDLFRFWPQTVKEVLDDDPIDRAVGSNKDVTLSHVAPFPESLIVVGDREQFTLGSGGKIFTPSNAVLDPTTSYTASATVPPASVGSTLYFVAPQSSFAAIREYSVQPDTLVTDAADITAHVTQLVRNSVKQLITENNLEYLFLINNEDYDSDGNEMLVYKFYWQGNEKVQSAWMKWNFWFNPLGGTTLNGQLYLIGTEYNGSNPITIITKVNLSDLAPTVLDDEGSPYKSTRPFIDRLSTNNNVASLSGDSLILEVTEDQYDYLGLQDANTVVVDRITGVKYQVSSRYTNGSEYFFILEQPDYLSSIDLDFDDTILGSYTLGGVPLDLPPAFPYVFPITLT